MFETTPYYQLIADYITETIEEEWTNAWIEMEFEEDYSGFKGRYISNQVKKSFRVNPLKSELREFWEKSSESHGKRWKYAKFSIDSTGKFKIDFDYESNEHF